MKLKLIATLGMLLVEAGSAHSQPTAAGDSVFFKLSAPTAGRVYLAGDFNNWNSSDLPMTRDSLGSWRRSVALAPGYYQYRFIVDGQWTCDPLNPATVLNNYDEPNSVFHLMLGGQIEYAAYQPGTTGKMSDEYPSAGGTLYLAIIWHQHQPFYLDASKDQLVGPWVRTHATKDYYDMTAMLKDYPDVHVSVNLTPVLLHQIEEYYLRRIGPFYDPAANRIQSEEFLAVWRGKTDPWVDLMLTPTADFGAPDDSLLWGGDWNAFGISRVQMARFPDYAALRDKSARDYTIQEKLNLKCWFYLAHFDPDFLRGGVTLATGETVNLTDMVEETSPGIFMRNRPFSETDANRLVAESVKVMAAIIPLHRRMRYQPASRQGQIEISTTPYYHPILPLIYDAGVTSSGSIGGGGNGVRFRHLDDARIQVKMAQEVYQRWFGVMAQGMWPGEGAVSADILSCFTSNDVAWIATGDGVLAKSQPPGLSALTPYRCSDGSGGDIAIFFRNTALSDYIGFKYQAYTGEEAADDFIRQMLRYAPAPGEKDRLMTVILDGENAWEWYQNDVDGKEFLHALYRKLTALYQFRQVVTVTPMEYLSGNPERGIPEHPIAALPALESLHAGSWINADFSTWIGEAEEDSAWIWLGRVREDLHKIAGHDSLQGDDLSDRRLAMQRAWREMYAAEGSDWFWWYGDDQNAPGGDRRFDWLFRSHLQQVYCDLQEAGFKVQIPVIPCLLGQPFQEGDERGVMHQQIKEK